MVAGFSTSTPQDPLLWVLTLWSSEPPLFELFFFTGRMFWQTWGWLLFTFLFVIFGCPSWFLEAISRRWRPALSFLCGSCLTLWSQNFASLVNAILACALAWPLKIAVIVCNWMSQCNKCCVKSWDSVRFPALLLNGLSALLRYISLAAACSAIRYSSVQVLDRAFWLVPLNKRWIFLFTVFSIKRCSLVSTCNLKKALIMCSIPSGVAYPVWEPGIYLSSDFSSSSSTSTSGTFNATTWGASVHVFHPNVVNRRPVRLDTLSESCNWFVACAGFREWRKTRFGLDPT